MTNNADALIAREWASKALDNDLLNELPIEGYRAAARHILATTTPPTMADIAWDDDVHVGLCAEHPEYGPVRMTRLDRDGDIWFLDDQLRLHFSHPDYLTPIPGTKIDLIPRREPESTPDHPAMLTTEKDYEGAPTGTIAAGDHAVPWFKHYLGFWLVCGADEGETSTEMSLLARRVLRWGETL